MAEYPNGFESRHPAPGPEASMGPHKASGGPTEMIPNTTGKGSRAKGKETHKDSPYGDIPGPLAPQVTQPDA